MGVHLLKKFVLFRFLRLFIKCAKNKQDKQMIQLIKAVTVASMLQIQIEIK